MNVRREVLNLFNVIATPTEVYLDLKEYPCWRMPFMFLVVSSQTVGTLMIPAVIEPMRKIFVTSFGEDAAEAAVRGAMKPIAVAQLAVEPFVRMIRWVIIAGSLFAVAGAFTKVRTIHFRNVFCTVAYNETIFILMNILTMLIIYLQGIETVQSEADLTIFRGVDYFLPASISNPALTSILANVNPFSVWYVISVGFGLAMLTDIERWKSIMIAAVGWLVWTICDLGRPHVTEFFISWLT